MHSNIYKSPQFNISLKNYENVNELFLCLFMSIMTPIMFFSCHALMKVSFHFTSLVVCAALPDMPPERQWISIGQPDRERPSGKLQCQ